MDDGSCFARERGTSRFPTPPGFFRLSCLLLTTCSRGSLKRTHHQSAVPTLYAYNHIRVCVSSQRMMAKANEKAVARVVLQLLALQALVAT